MLRRFAQQLRRVPQGSAVLAISGRLLENAKSSHRVTARPGRNQTRQPRRRSSAVRRGDERLT